MAVLDDMEETESETGAIISYAELEMAILDEIEERVTYDCGIETVGEVEEDVQVIQDLEQPIEENPEIASKDPVAIDDEEEAPVGSQDAFASPVWRGYRS